MSDTDDKITEQELTATRIDEAEFEEDEGQTGAVKDGTPEEDLLEEDAIIARRRAMGNAVDDNAASNQGGMGAQGGQSDFGAAGNLSGYDKDEF